LNEKMASRILRTLSREKTFYFFTSIGNYTGQSASSLKDFMDKINEVNVKSLEFHFCRGDFEKWIAEVLEDKALAEYIRKLQQQDLTGDKLRIQLHKTISKRYNRLKNQSNNKLNPTFF